jgi:hypothetical protein
MEIHRDGIDGKFWVITTRVHGMILRKFGMNDVKLVKSFWLSIISFLQVCVRVMKKKRVICLVYGMLVEILMNAMRGSDISHAVGVVSGHMTNPGGAVKWVLQFWKH